MFNHTLSTPFGAGDLTPHVLMGYRHGAACPPKAEAAKWKILRDLSVARRQFALSDRAVTVLSALLSCFPSETLKASDDLLVFPSNAELSRRAHGACEATLRRCLAQLVDAGLILRRDSPNGKRYARRDAEGKIVRAYGFDLRPLLARAPDIDAACDALQQERRASAMLREEATLLRRDIRKMLAYFSDNPSACSNPSSADSFTDLDTMSNRGLSTADLQDLCAKLRAIREALLNDLKSLEFSQNPSANDGQNDCHKQDSIQISNFESEPDLEKADTAATDCVGTDEDKTSVAAKARPEPQAGVPLDLVLKACPDIQDYAARDIRSWKDLNGAVAVVRAMLGVTADAWRNAERSMGATNAAITMAAILQHGDKIRCPGGYLRNLTLRASGGGYSPKPVITALLRGGVSRAGQSGDRNQLEERLSEQGDQVGL